MYYIYNMCTSHAAGLAETHDAGFNTRFDVFFLNLVVNAITSCKHACTSAGCMYNIMPDLNHAEENT